MEARAVDPRDVDSEVDRPPYRVTFWSLQSPRPDSGHVAREYELTEVNDVSEVLAWAREEARSGETFVVYARVGDSLVRLEGHDPTRNDA